MLLKASTVVSIKRILKKMETKLRLGYITVADPYDKRSWSGIHYQMVKALEKQGFLVIPLGPVVLHKFAKKFLAKALYYLDTFHKLFFGKGYNVGHSYLVSYFHGNFFRNKIRKNKIDILFAPAASNQIAHLNTKIPICYYSDATVAVMLDYYDFFSGFSRPSMRESNGIEQRAINKSKSQVFSSKWAYDSAIRDYKAKNAFIVKMGANIDAPPPEAVTGKNYDAGFELLFIGVDWQRKGGDLVLETFEKLYNYGYDIRLTVIGCVPPKVHSSMKVIPFLNKNLEQDIMTFDTILRNAHLLFLPSRADCTPIVFCEANAFGLPVISTKTGGVPSVIEDGINGYTLPVTATSEDYFKVIEGLITDKDSMKGLAKSARKKYDEELNWNRWGIQMKKILLQTAGVEECADYNLYANA